MDCGISQVGRTWPIPVGYPTAGASAGKTGRQDSSAASRPPCGGISPRSGRSLTTPASVAQWPGLETGHNEGARAGL